MKVVFKVKLHKTHWEWQSSNGMILSINMLYIYYANEFNNPNSVPVYPSTHCILNLSIVAWLKRSKVLVNIFTWLWKMWAVDAVCVSTPLNGVGEQCLSQF